MDEKRQQGIKATREIQFQAASDTAKAQRWEANTAASFKPYNRKAKANARVACANCRYQLYHLFNSSLTRSTG
jgi:hypothetical protein